ncbi:MAG: tripartite tricarboxylate transporter TctB family protein [Candidatus Wenzhouxiangella sp. M2_3B_020]
MTVRHLDTLVAGALVVFGLYLIGSGWNYGFMRGTTPGPGLFPALTGIAVTVLSAVNLVRGLAGREEVRAGMPRAEVVKVVALTLCIAGVIVAAKWLGLTLATMLMIVASSLVIEPRMNRVQAVKVLAVALAIPLAARWLFGSVLGVPLLTGPFGL